MAKYETKGGRIWWMPEKLNKQINVACTRNMTAALAFLKRETQRNVNILAKVQRTEKYSGGKLAQPIRDHSEPGEFPRKIRGDLQRGIYMTPPRVSWKSIEGDVGTKLSYGVYHEIAERPYIRRTLMEMRHWIGHILSGKKIKKA